MSNSILNYLTSSFSDCFVKFAGRDNKVGLDDLEAAYQDALIEKDLSLKELAPSDSWIKRLFSDPYRDKVRNKDLYKKLVNVKASPSEQVNQKAIGDLIGLSNPDSLRLARVLANIARIEDIRNNKTARPILPLPSRLSDPALIQKSMALNKYKLDTMTPQFRYMLNLGSPL